MNNYRIQLNKKWAFGFLYALLMVILFVRYVFQISFPDVVIQGITILMVCLGDRDQIVAVCMLCIPLTTAFQDTYTLLTAAVLLVVKHGKSIRINLTAIPLLLLVFWELLHCVTGVFSVKHLIAMFLPFLLWGLLLWQDAQKIDYGYVIRSFALCTCVMCITLLSMVMARANFNLAAAAVQLQRLGSATERSGEITLTINPNSLGIMCAMAICGLVQLMLLGKRKPMDLPMVIVLLVSGALSLSRTYLALLLIAAVLFWMAQEGSIGKKIGFLFRLVLFALLAFGLLYILFPTAVEGYIHRFEVSDLTSGRSLLMRKYHEFLWSSPEILLFGIGLTGFSERIMDMHIAYNVPHNGFQEAMCAWGLIGFMLFLTVLLVSVIRAERTGGKKKLLNYIPLLVLLAKIQAGQMLTSDYTMLLFPLAYLSLCQDFSGAKFRKRKKVFYFSA